MVKNAKAGNPGKAQAKGAGKANQTGNELKKSAKIARKQVRSNALSKDVEEVVMAFIQPGLESEVRFSSPYTTGATSLCQLHTPYNVKFGTNTYLDTSESSTAFVFRDPVRHCVLFDANPLSELISYELMFNKSVGGTDTVSNTFLGAPGPLSVAYARPLAGGEFDAHGPIQGVGLANGNKTYIWSQKNYTWDGPTTDSEGYAVRVFKWTPRGDNYVGSFVFNTMGDIDVDGYIRFEVYYVNTGITTMDLVGGGAEEIFIKYTCNGPIFRQLPLVNYDSKASTVEKIRILSAGMLLTNTAPAIARGGKVASKQFPGDEPWYEFALGGYDAIARLVDADVRDASNGAWGFLKPTALSDLEMSDNIDYQGADLIKFGFDLDSVRAFIGTYAVLPSAAGQAAQFTPCVNIEFETDDPWYSRAISEINPKVFDEAVHATASIIQFNENPEHLKDAFAAMKKYSKSALEALKKYGPTALEVAGTIAALL